MNEYLEVTENNIDLVVEKTSMSASYFKAALNMAAIQNTSLVVFTRGGEWSQIHISREHGVPISTIMKDIVFA